MSEKKANHQANIVKITEILPHNNADNLVIIPIGQYQVVARKGDFEIGSLGVYIQPDSVVPQTEPFRFIWEPYQSVIATAYTEDMSYKYGEIYSIVLEKYRRITVRKFRGEWSEGLLLPVRDFGFADKGNVAELLETYSFQVGDDVSNFLGITHYDPDAGKEDSESIDLVPRKRRKYPKTLNGWFKFIFYRFVPRARRKYEFIDLSDKIDVPAYDVESFKNYPNVFNEGELVIVTEKIHGSNARYVCIDDVMYIGSHYKWRSLHANDAFTKALAANPWIEEWCRVHQGYVLYGEVTPTQGGFNYGTEKPQFFLFDIRDPNGKWVPVNEYSSLGITCTEGPEGQCTDYPEHLVPVLYIGPYVKEYILSLVDGPSLAAKGAHVHEGIVIKTVEERYARGIGRAQVKLVSNTFLDKDSKLK